jgi:hypothetical protein
MALSITAIQTAAMDLLTCVCAAIDQLPSQVAGLMGCPCRTGVVAGTPAADGCDEDCTAPGPGEWPGQLTVNVARLFASDGQSFPRERDVFTVRDKRNCQPPQVTAVELVITLFRCTPLPSDLGCPPSMADLTANAMQIHADMLAVQQGILCCFADTDPTRLRGRRYTVGDTRALGPQGGCAGFETRVIVALDDCIPCPTPEPVDAD